MGLLNIVKGALDPLFDTIDKLIPDKDKRAELKAQLSTQRNTLVQTLLNAQRDVIVAEAQGESWLQRSWRPLIMLSFGAIIVNNYILSPYLQAMFGWQVTLEIPTDMWDLLKIGIGGYIVGRSGEKITKEYRKNNPKQS